MLNISAKSVLISVVLPIGILASGCAPGIGSQGLNDVVAGNWPEAKQHFASDFQNHREHPIAVFNMGVTNSYDGNRDQAANLYSEAVVRGKDTYGDRTLEPDGVDASVARHACARLHRDNRLDVNCGDQIVAQVVIPPAPPAPVAQAEPAPAMAAQATYDEPIQSRN